jgi:hypothetical protein
MTLKELHEAGFDRVYCFVKPEEREAFKLRAPEHIYAEAEEVYCTKGFKVLYLGMKDPNHVPVRYTPPQGCNDPSFTR